MHEDLRDELADYLAIEIRKDVDRALDLYRGLAGHIWLKDGEEYFLTWKEAGAIVADIRTEAGCPNEDYLDYYLSGGEGEVSEWLEQKIELMGYSITDQPF